MSSNKQEILTETAFMTLKSKDQIQVPTMELTQPSSLKASSHNGTNNKKIPRDGRNDISPQQHLKWHCLHNMIGNNGNWQVPRPHVAISQNHTVVTNLKLTCTAVIDVK